MLSVGTNIQSPADELKKIDIEYLFNAIRSPKPDIKSQIRQLRIIRALDTRKYAQLKKQLPYVVCGCFNPPFRKTENFAYTEYFILDIDHISSHEKNIQDIRGAVQADSRVLLSFLSPGEDGLKIVFRLSEKCWDAGLYSLFYKTFCKKFEQQYHLDKMIDYRTSDVCRACFVSLDPDIYYNINAHPVNISDYVDIEDVSSMLDLKRQQDKEERELYASEHSEKQTSEFSPDPDIEVMRQIRLKLQGKMNQKEEIEVPEELDAIIAGLQSAFEDNGIQIVDISNIQYGKRIKMQLGLKKAEFNLFYGKKGFTVVSCPRTGTNAELNALCADLARAFIADQTR